MFLTMFFKTQNIGQTMHLTMLIAHPYGQLGAGQLDPGAQLSGAQLSGAQLSGAQLSGAQFA